VSAETSADLQRIYEARFAKSAAYRKRVWKILVPQFFQQFIRSDAAVLDLGCGYGEFINEVRCGAKFAMDLNPDARGFLDPSIAFLEQDCTVQWQIAPASLDVVFTSNFFEHLPDKTALGRTLEQAHRCLRSGGHLIAMGPNIRFLPGAYWDFWDHYLPLTELSLGEGLANRGFEVVKSVDRFLPYTLVRQREYPDLCLQFYLKLPLVWRFLGRQFVVVAQKRAD
jgi:SAM-dependent methyltransferase